MAKANTVNVIFGVILILLGALMLASRLNVPFLAEAAAVALIVVGILILVGKMSGGQVLGIVAIVGGVAILVVGALASSIAWVLNLALGGALVVGGIMKLMGKW